MLNPHSPLDYVQIRISLGRVESQVEFSSGDLNERILQPPKQGVCISVFVPTIGPSDIDLGLRFQLGGNTL